MVQIRGKEKGKVINQLGDLWQNTQFPGWVRVGTPGGTRLNGKEVDLQKRKK